MTSAPLCPPPFLPAVLSTGFEQFSEDTGSHILQLPRGIKDVLPGPCASAGAPFRTSSSSATASLMAVQQISSRCLTPGILLGAGGFLVACCQEDEDIAVWQCIN